MKKPSAFMLSLLILLALSALIAGCYFIPYIITQPARTPLEAAERSFWDPATEAKPLTRLEPADADTAIAVYYQPESPGWINVGYALVVREGGGWEAQAGGGTTIQPRADDKVMVHAGPPKLEFGPAFVYGYLIDPAIQSVEAIFANGERREDQPEARLFLFTFDPDTPPCQLRFLDADDNLIEELDLAKPSSSGGLTRELLESAQAQCTSASPAPSE